jgi:3',5'-cyclic-AMP phosphodiesterase
MRREFILVQLSDLHLTGKGETDEVLKVLGEGVVTELSKLNKDAPRILAVTGDLVDYPSNRSLGAARTFLESLKADGSFQHMLIIPGNHDVKQLFGMFRSTEQFMTFFGLKGQDNSILLRECGLHLIGIDSTPASWARGQIQQRQYDVIVLEAYKSEKLPKDEQKGMLRIIAVHHHPLPLAKGEDQKMFGVRDESFMYLESPAKFLNACLDADVALIMNGHRHVTGLARYSVPGLNRRDNSYGDDIWRNLYILSCPSSTGSGCQAGFNVIAPDENAAFLTLRRYYREANKGPFKPLDYNFPGEMIRLRYGERFIRDVAVDVAAQIQAMGEDVPPRKLLSKGEQLFRRRAFTPSPQNSWGHLLYAIIRTRLTWEQVVVPRMDAVSKPKADQVTMVLNGLETFVADTALGLSAVRHDDLRNKYIDDKHAFLEQTPDLPLDRDLQSLLLQKRKQLEDLSAALLQCNINLQNLLKAPNLPE